MAESGWSNEGFGELLRHEPFLRAFARELVADENDADDLVQQAWLACLKRPPDPERPARPWLARVVHNALRQARRGESRRRRRETEVADALPRQAEDKALASMVLAELREEIEALPATSREVIRMRYFQDLPPSEIARELGVPVETVRTRIKRGLSLLRARLDRRNDGDRFAWVSSLVLLLGTHGLLTLDPRPGPASRFLRSYGGAAALGVCLLATVGIVASIDVEPPAGSVLAADDTVPRVTERPGVPSAEALDRRLAVPEVRDPTASPVPSNDATRAVVDYGGRVLDPRGRPSPGVYVQAFEGTYPNFLDGPAPLVHGMTRSGRDGRFWLAGMPEGSCVMAWTANGVLFGLSNSSRGDARSRAVAWSLEQHEEPAARPDPTDLQIRLFPRVTLRVGVVDPLGDPVTGARVQIHGQRFTHRELFTDEEGAAYFDWIFTSRILYVGVDAGDRGQGVLGPFVPRSRSEELPFTLEAATELAGRVVGADGTPAAGVVVGATKRTVRPLDAPDEKLPNAMLRLLAGARSATTDSGGRFRLRGLAPDAYDLTVRPRASATAAAFAVAEAGAEDVEIVLGSGFDDGPELHGRVLDGATGEPIDDFVLGAYRRTTKEDLGEDVLVRGGADGRFLVRGRSAGPWFLFVTAEGYAPGFVRKKFEAGRHEVVFRLHARRDLRLDLRDRLGTPLAGTRVVASGLDGELFQVERADGSWRSVSLADEDGLVDLNGLPATEVRLELWPPYRFEPCVLSVNLEAESLVHEVRLDYDATSSRRMVRFEPRFESRGNAASRAPRGYRLQVYDASGALALSWGRSNPAWSIENVVPDVVRTGEGLFRAVPRTLDVAWWREETRRSRARADVFIPDLPLPTGPVRIVIEASGYETTALELDVPEVFNGYFRARPVLVPEQRGR